MFVNKIISCINWNILSLISLKYQSHLKSTKLDVSTHSDKKYVDT